ncbi:MAG: hypothetical protein OXO52_18330, partial [Rhodospirillales bacterium]|nr:hypothetical protein [Rhodospirillales bacterium]
AADSETATVSPRSSSSAASGRDIDESSAMSVLLHPSRSAEADRPRVFYSGGERKKNNKE